MKKKDIEDKEDPTKAEEEPDKGFLVVGIIYLLGEPINWVFITSPDN